jgi:hypothetical protein
MSRREKTEARGQGKRGEIVKLLDNCAAEGTDSVSLPRSSSVRSNRQEFNPAGVQNGECA